MAVFDRPRPSNEKVCCLGLRGCSPDRQCPVCRERTLAGPERSARRTPRCAATPNNYLLTEPADSTGRARREITPPCLHLEPGTGGADRGGLCKNRVRLGPRMTIRHTPEDCRCRARRARSGLGSITPAHIDTSVKHSIVYAKQPLGRRLPWLCCCIALGKERLEACDGFDGCSLADYG